MEEQRLISHMISPEGIDATLKRISDQIKKQDNDALFSESQKLKLLQQLSELNHR